MMPSPICQSYVHVNTAVKLQKEYGDAYKAPDDVSGMEDMQELMPVVRPGDASVYDFNPTYVLL